MIFTSRRSSPMHENVSRNNGAPWTPQGVAKLQELWTAGVPYVVIAATLGRTQGEIGAKASELKLSRPS
jgi:hypothetical protein